MLESINFWVSEFTRRFSDYIWIIQIFLIVFATLLASYLINRSFKHAAVRLKKTKNLWDDALFDALRKPLIWLIWVLGLSLAAELAEFSAYRLVKEAAVIVLIAWFLWRFTFNVESNVLLADTLRHKPDATTVHAIGKLLRASVVITASLVLLQTFGYSISGVLAFGGISGVVVGFAAKDLLANFFGALMIYLDRPFAVGDWVRSPDREIEGTIEDIGWRLTRIRTFDKRPLYVPNAMFANISVENPSRMSHRRIYETVGIRYNDSAHMGPIVESVKEMLMQHPEIDQTQTMIVNFNKFAPSSLDFFIYTFTRTTNWVHYHQVKQDVLLKVMNIIIRHGAEVAFPTSTIHLFQESEKHETHNH